MVQFNLPGFVYISVTNKGHILLSKPDWFHPYAVTTVKRIPLSKVTKFEHELQKESNVHSVIEKALFFFFFKITKCSLLIYLDKTGITIPSRE